MIDLSSSLPEVSLIITICLVLLGDLYFKRQFPQIGYFLAQVSLIIAFYLTMQQFSMPESTAFSGTFVRDELSTLLKLFIQGITFAVFLYSRDYIKTRQILRGEFYTLGLCAVLGMMVMVSASSFISLYLGLELLSLSLYAMVAMRRDSKVVAEAAMKYFVMGALASGMLLYGISLVYGVTQTLFIPEVAQFVGGLQSPNLVLSVGLVFIVVAIAFKLGAVPFHMWIPDVYQGAPTSVVAFISTAPKIAAFGMITRLLLEGLPALHIDWQPLLICLSVLSIGVGNLIAIAQTNFKRMLAYSAIAHVGFFLLGILSGTAEGYSASLFYILVYAIMSLGAFGMIIFLSREGFESENIDDLKGLAARSPWFAFVLLLLMFSMAGVPPTVGFYAKFSVLKAIVDIDLVWLAIYAVFFSIIGAFYYLRIVKTVFFDQPETKPVPLLGARDIGFVLSLNGLSILALGLFPSALMVICHQIFA